MKEFLLKNLFFTSKQPVLFRDLLEANALFNEGMLVDGAKLNFKFNYTKLYCYYAAFCAVILGLLTLAFHTILAKVDSHFSIIISVVVTAAVYAGIDGVRVWLRRQKSAECLKAAWKVHFPYFPYEKYSQKVELIYGEALKREVPRKELEKFVLDAIIKETSGGAKTPKSANVSRD